MTISHSESIVHLMTAVLAVQAKVDGVAKDAKGNRSTYASLEAVTDALRQPCLDAHLVVTQAPGECIEGTLAVTTMLAHADSGEWLRSTLQLPLAKPGDPQMAGSAITYARRYSLMALFNLPAVDDDGEAASRPVQRPAPRPVSQGPESPEGPVAPPPASPDGIRARMLAAVGKAATFAALTDLTEHPQWKAEFSPLPEAHRKTIMAAITRRHDEIGRSMAQGMAG